MFLTILFIIIRKIFQADSDLSIEEQKTIKKSICVLTGKKIVHPRKKKLQDDKNRGKSTAPVLSHLQLQRINQEAIAQLQLYTMRQKWLKFLADLWDCIPHMDYKNPRIVPCTRFGDDTHCKMDYLTLLDGYYTLVHKHIFNNQQTCQDPLDSENMFSFPSDTG